MTRASVTRVLVTRDRWGHGVSVVTPEWLEGTRAR